MSEKTPSVADPADTRRKVEECWQAIAWASGCDVPCSHEVPA